MSGVREGLLSVQDSGRPQDVTHAGEGTEAQQDQIIQPHQRGGASVGRTGTLEQQRAKTATVTVQLLSFFPSSSQRLEVEHLDVTGKTSSRRKHFPRRPKE